MKVLIVGGAGYIGTHVVHAFMDNGVETAVLDNFSSGTRKNLPGGIEIFEGDIADKLFLNKVFSQKWDGAVHLAAFKAAGESMENPGKYAENNIAGTINLLNAVTEAAMPAFVFSSSAAVFGEPEYLPIDEEHPTVPTNFYGFTKLAIENLMDWYAQLKNFRFASLRYFNAAGYDIQGRVTEPERSPQNLLPIIMETAAGLRESLTINGSDYDTPDGTCIRDYIHVSDLADAHVLSMQYLLDRKTSIKINLGSEKGISVAQMADEAMRVTGFNFPRTVGGRREGDPARLIASSAKARELLGWEASRSDTETLLSSAWAVYERLKRKF
ncbi:MAG: UDP-glucose 4-epimerase GalE [Spirochaeta sp. LUC14_002_19_P3]|nr:MAG: UDP-glucose 4-epimerase GalE [Spirochaeta sp. LUC14_002_19_P3]